MIEIPEGYVIVRAIVRCKDCKYWRKIDKAMYCTRHRHIFMYMDADDFCSRGEKR